MTSDHRLSFRIASREEEFDQIFRLAYETFVEEIPQHPPNPERRHVDRFHDQNTYLVALDGDRVVGMITVRSQRPFSLDEKLGGVDRFLPPGRRICEVRLLAVIPEYRKTPVFYGLAKFMAEYGLAQGFDLAIISGTLRQQKLYRHLGFVPFAHLVGSEEAPFQPMYLTFEDFEKRAAPALRVRTTASAPSEPLSFLPGPVRIRSEVRKAFESAPVSHRSGTFRTQMSRLREKLGTLVSAPHAEVMLGSGTLANDVIAAQLSVDGDPGLVVSNGEFGDRLADHARRFGLECSKLDAGWGNVIEERVLRSGIRQRPDARWLWATACETSTGHLNDVVMMARLCREYGLRLCLDAISAVGTVPIDLGGAFLASAVSGKGLGSYPGLAIVYHSHEVAPRPDRIPRYLDLGYYAAWESVPFTHSSNLVAALLAALEHLDVRAAMERSRGLVSRLRSELGAASLRFVAPEAVSSPAILTVELPPPVRSVDVGRALAGAGFLLSFESAYLTERNWVQICLMGDYTRTEINALAAAVLETCRHV